MKVAPLPSESQDFGPVPHGHGGRGDRIFSAGLAFVDASASRLGDPLRSRTGGYTACLLVAQRLEILVGTDVH
jgi:hypothetical protein